MLIPRIWKRLASTYKWSYVHGVSNEPLTGLSLGQLIDRSAEKYGTSRDAVVSMHQGPLRKSFTDVKNDAEKLACGLLALGLERGDRVGIWGPNSYEWYQTQMAAAKAGLVLVNVNPAYKSSELLYCINKVGIKAIIAAESFKTTDYVQIYESLSPDSIPTLQHFILITDKTKSDAKSSISFKDLLHAGTQEHREKLNELADLIQMDDPVNIQFTSGTTGNPKGACLSHHNIVNNGKFIGLRIGYDKKAHRICCAPPLYHTFGCVIGNVTALTYGAAMILPGPHFNAKDCMAAIESEKCTSIYGTPTMFVDMISMQRANKYNVDTVETGIMAGSPCPVQLCQDVVQVLNAKNFTVCYGMTETSPVTFQGFPNDSKELKTTTIGFPSAHTEVKVVDEVGNIVPTGTPGELCTRAYSSMLGYWNDEGKTAEIIKTDRWLHSGDVAIIYPNGYGQIVGRIKDLVIRGGENLYPREIEEVLVKHPSILDAYVVGVPDPRYGEELCAWIKVKESIDKPLTSEDVKTFCKETLAHFKVPKYIVFVEEFPVTVTGKVQKMKMREQSIVKLGLKS